MFLSTSIRMKREQFQLYSKIELQDLEEIMKIPGDKMSTRLAYSILEDVELYLPKLTQIMFSNRQPYNWRAAWVIGMLGRLNPESIDKWFTRNSDAIHQVREEKVITSILSLLAIVKLPIDQLSGFYDFASKQAVLFGADNKVYYALKFMLRMAKVYPELMEEVKLVAAEIHERTEKPYLLKYTKGIIKSDRSN